MILTQCSAGTQYVYFKGFFFALMNELIEAEWRIYASVN